jgi:LCP family protein required for cell wall assembly
MAKHMSDDIIADSTTSAAPVAADDVELLHNDALHQASSQDHEGLRRVRRRHSTYKKNLTIGLGILGASVVLLAGIVLFWVSSLDRSMRMDPEESKALVESLAAPGVTGDEDKPDAYYVLIVGSDARSSVDGARGDVMMLARVDEANSRVHLISIPRDTIIATDGGGEMKINASFAYGGAAGAVDCVSEFAGVPISHYVEVDFDGAIEVIDELGGVWVSVPEAFTSGDQVFAKGRQLLTGERALLYARQRYAFSGGDFTRAQSQRQIVESVAEQIVTMTPAQIPGVVKKLAAMVSTDYKTADLVSLALAFNKNRLTLYSSVCPSFAFNKDGVSYVGTMLDEWQDMMRRVDAGFDPDDTTQVIPEVQATNETLGAATNSATPKNYQELAASSGLTTQDVNTPAG